MNEHDPGDLYEGPPPRRRYRREYRRESEIDDAWAAADEDDFYDDHVEIEDLAAGYIWDDTEKLGLSYDGDDTETPPASDLGPLPPSAKRLSQRRRLSREARIRDRYDRSQAYADSPSYRKSRQNVVERMVSRLGGDDELYAPGPRKPKHGDPDYTSGPLGQIPYWGILILVILAVFAVLVTVLAAVSMLTLLG